MPPDPEIIIKDNSTDLAVAAADIFTATAKECITHTGRFTIALSGGSTPRTLYRTLAEEPYYSLIPWDKIHIFWVDERCVQQNDPASNYGAVKKDLLDRVPIPIEQIHPMLGEAFPEKGAVEYQRELRAFFRIKNGEFPVFNLIFLGIGKDGHTASLFPGQKALEERERLVTAVKGGNPDVSRITLTFPLLNHAEKIIFLVSGNGKALILKAIFEDNAAQLPAQKVRPINGKLTWLIDREAGSLLTGGK